MVRVEESHPKDQSSILAADIFLMGFFCEIRGNSDLKFDKIPDIYCFFGDNISGILFRTRSERSERSVRTYKYRPFVFYTGKGIMRVRGSCEPIDPKNA